MIAILEITSKGMVSMLVGTNSRCAVEAQVLAMVKSSGIVQILRSNRTPIRVVEGQEGAKVAMVMIMKAMMMMTLAAAGVASQRMTLAVADVANQRRTLAAAGVAKRMTLAAADVANQRVAAAGVAALAAAGAANLVDVVAGVSAESSWGTSVHHVHELG